MATPRVKRSLAGAASDPSQRSITSFFARDEEAGERRATSSPRVASPPLPPSVQADLLAVGMRVRKSVPEGYKTGKEAIVPMAKTVHRPAAAPCPPRELLPFCGLHRVGGLGVQALDEAPQFSPAVFAGEDGDDMDLPGLTSSQETVLSDDEPATRKRLRSQDDVDEEAWEVDAVPPAFYQLGRRVLAVPRRRRQQKFHQQQLSWKGAQQLDQENGCPAEDDFDEADFLEASTWAERDLEMGGC